MGFDSERYRGLWKKDMREREMLNFCFLFLFFKWFKFKWVETINATSLFFFRKKKIIIIKFLNSDVRSTMMKSFAAFARWWFTNQTKFTREGGGAPAFELKGLYQSGTHQLLLNFIIKMESIPINFNSHQLLLNFIIKLESIPIKFNFNFFKIGSY